ncbi:MAG TPA: hypothetical protein VGW33_12345 [Terriglobia bacterium]|nr:hypothetical protein [Terriglobia bacterium]
MKRTFAILLLVLASGVAVPGRAAARSQGRTAQNSTAPPSNLTLDQVLDKYVQALGGKAAIEKVTSRVMTGSIESPATGDTGSLVPGTIEVDAKAPNQRAVIIDFPGSDGDHHGFNGTSGWYVDPDDGPQDLPPDALGAVKLESEFYRDTRLRELFPKIALKGTAKVNGQEAFVVEAPHADGGIEKLYFDTHTGLMVRDEVPVDVPGEGRTTIVNDLSDYRDVDGIKLPFAIHQTSPDFEYIIKFKEIRQNVTMDDARFEKPKAGSSQ